MNKPEYISKLESEGEFFSQLNFNPLKKVYDFWKTKKVNKVFQISEATENGLKAKDVIYKSAQGFFIFISNTQEDDWMMTIYYRIEQENELKLFTKNLIKQIYDATTNNR